MSFDDRFFTAIERHGGALFKPAGSRDPSEMCVEGGDCPNCHRAGADERAHVADRLRVFAVDAYKRGRARGHWFCHRCRENGDGVDFIMRYFRLPKSEWASVYEEVTGERPPDRQDWVPRAGQVPARASSTTRPVTRPELQPAAEPEVMPAQQVQPEPARSASWAVRPNPYPNVNWTAKATVLACRLHPAEYRAGDQALAEARHWLEEERGIKLEFAADCGIFWNPRPVSLSRTQCAEWGLDWSWIGIPKGVVIMQQRYCHNVTPADLLESAYPVGMQVRLAVPKPNGNRLMWIPWRNDGQDVPGVRSLALGLRGLPVVVTESALDAVLVLQEAGGWDKLAVVSPCGAAYALDEDAAKWLRQAPEIWAWPDADEAGEQAFRRWQRTFPNMQKIEMPKDADGKPVAKDPTDLAKQCRQNPNLPTVRQILKKNGVTECQTICLWR